jgi:hypothetical protein
VSAGVWMVPVVLAGVVLFLGLATWLERRPVTVPAVDAERSHPAALDAADTDPAAGPERLGSDRRFAAALHRTGEESPECGRPGLSGL